MTVVEGLPRVLIDAPPVAVERKFGLYSVTTPQPIGPHEAMGVEYEPELCLLPDALSVAPCDESPPKVANVDFDARVEGDAYAIYAAANCKPVGRSLQAISERVRRVLDAGEEPAVERGLWPILAVDAVDVTGGVTAVTVLEGVKRLERAVSSFGVTAIFLAPRELSADMSHLSLLWERAGRMETAVGSRVAFIDYDETYGPTDGSGEEPTPAPVGTSWMYAVSGVVIRRGDVIDQPPTSAMVRNEAGNYTNETFLLSERVIVPTVDCLRFAVLVENDLEGVS